MYGSTFGLHTRTVPISQIGELIERARALLPLALQ